ncbi:MAG: hypothetical protein M1549_00855 [Candidatus Dependentiae bacterium]|nr:hypothetical protein [Candidatus Dependentiae bacterium]
MFGIKNFAWPLSGALLLSIFAVTPVWGMEAETKIDKKKEELKIEEKKEEEEKEKEGKITAELIEQWTSWLGEENIFLKQDVEEDSKKEEKDTEKEKKKEKDEERFKVSEVLNQIATGNVDESATEALEDFLKAAYGTKLDTQADAVLKAMFEKLEDMEVDDIKKLKIYDVVKAAGKEGAFNEAVLKATVAKPTEKDEKNENILKKHEELQLNEVLPLEKGKIGAIYGDSSNVPPLVAKLFQQKSKVVRGSNFKLPDTRLTRLVAFVAGAVLGGVTDSSWQRYVMSFLASISGAWGEDRASSYKSQKSAAVAGHTSSLATGYLLGLATKDVSKFLWPLAKKVAKKVTTFAV